MPSCPLAPVTSIFIKPRFTDSKIVSSRIQDMSSTYPAGFFDLFGSVPDFDIDEPEELDFNLDSKREQL